MEEKPRNAPSTLRDIKNVSASDLRVRVLGKITDVQENTFVLEDASGRITVQGTAPQVVGDQVRVFGRPVREGETLSLAMEVIQDMKGLNEKLYKTWMALNKTEV